MREDASLICIAHMRDGTMRVGQSSIQLKKRDDKKLAVPVVMLSVVSQSIIDLVSELGEGVIAFGGGLQLEEAVKSQLTTLLECGMSIFTTSKKSLISHVSVVCLTPCDHLDSMEFFGVHDRCDHEENEDSDQIDEEDEEDELELRLENLVKALHSGLIRGVNGRRTTVKDAGTVIGLSESLGESLHKVLDTRFAEVRNRIGQLSKSMDQHRSKLDAIKFNNENLTADFAKGVEVGLNGVGADKLKPDASKAFIDGWNLGCKLKSK